MRKHGARTIHYNKTNNWNNIKCSVSRKQSVGMIETLQAAFGDKCSHCVNPLDSHNYERRVTITVRLERIRAKPVGKVEEPP